METIRWVEKLLTHNHRRKKFCVRAMISELSWRQIIAWIFHVIWNKQLLAASVHADHADGASNRVCLVLYILWFLLFYLQIAKTTLRGYSTPGPYFWRLCIFSKNKAALDKLSYWSGQKCSKELKNCSFTSVETIVVKLQ